MFSYCIIDRDLWSAVSVVLSSPTRETSFRVVSLIAQTAVTDPSFASRSSRYTLDVIPFKDRQEE